MFEIMYTVFMEPKIEENFADWLKDQTVSSINEKLPAGVTLSSLCRPLPENPYLIIKMFLPNAESFEAMRKASKSSGLIQEIGSILLKSKDIESYLFRKIL